MSKQDDIQRKTAVEEVGVLAKFRHELKYECSVQDLEALRCRLSAIMRLDSHVDERGLYHIRSIYFDDFDNSSFTENEDGVNLREKWRIRAYNCSDQNLALECKRKENGMIQKKSCRITLEQFRKLLSMEPIGIDKDVPQLLIRFSCLQRARGMVPKIIVGYDRRPYVYHAGNVRVTFDMNIFSSTDIDSFFSENIRHRPILPTNRHLLEVKYDEYIPDHIYRSIQMTNMQLSTFSKYYLCRKYNI